jgi:hypothetical protein
MIHLKALHCKVSGYKYGKYSKNYKDDGRRGGSHRVRTINQKLSRRGVSGSVLSIDAFQKDSRPRPENSEEKQFPT